MASGPRKKGFLEGLGLVEATETPPEEAGAQEAPSSRRPARAAPPPSGGAPQSISTHLRTTAPAATAAPSPAIDTSERVTAILQEVVAKVPADNAVAQVIAADASLASAIADPVARRNAAIGSVKAIQKVSDTELATEGREIKEAINAHLDGLVASAEAFKKGDVGNLRRDAQALRTKIAGNLEKIAALEQENAADTARAEALDADADAKEADADRLLQDIEAARAAALETYRV